MAEEEKDTQLQRFGRYLILDHLVDGGMAKICRARFLGEQGNKIVAIKMIQGQYSSDPSFKQMFMDEIKVTFGLNHPNIAQTYDYGLLNGQLYTAIEYVDGQNLKQFLDRLKERKFVFPVEISTFIISQVCQGLTYAHNFTDKLTGKVLNIIHRDISPHNIMITYDGAVKVIDFGIAKAETNSEETKAGTIKGKLSYLAPEYLEGMDLDHRYDQFAVGITLWELLCSRKLFQAPNELATLKKIQACKVPPPSSINPNVPKELDQIVLKSLNKDRNLRFQNMDQFNRALVKFLYSHYPDFNATDLNYFAKELFKDDIKEDREKLFKYGQIDITPFLNDYKNEMEGNSSSGQQSASSNGTTAGHSSASSGHREEPKGGQKVTVLEFGLDDDDKDKTGAKKGLSLDLDKTNGKGIGPRTGPSKSTRTSGQPARPGSRNSGMNDASNPNTRIGATRTNKVTETSHKAAPKIDNDEVKRGNSADKDEVEGGKSKGILKLGGVIAVGFTLFFYRGKIEELVGLKKNEAQSAIDTRAPSSVKSKNPRNEAPKMVKVVFINTNPFQQFYINNEEVKQVVGGIDLPIGSKVFLRVEQDYKLPIYKSFTVTESGPSSIQLPNPKPGFFGILRSSSDYSDNSTLTITIDGEEIVLPLPLGEVKIPVGKYRGVIQDGLSGVSKEVSFEMVENTITKLPK